MVAVFATGVIVRPQLNPRANWWAPAVGTTWQIELINPLTNTSVNAAVYDIDLWDNGPSIISQLHSQGRKVICYYSAGTYEPGRDDSNAFRQQDKGRDVVGWPDEKWLNTKSDSVRSIMLARLDRAKSIGCDGVDPDNVDGYGDNNTGFGLTENDAVDYVTFLSNAAHERGMASGLKNGGEIIDRVIDIVDFCVNEECAIPENDECDTFHAFIDAGKPVFHIEYPEGAPNRPPSQQVINQLCNANGSDGFSTVLKGVDLEDWLIQCPL